MLLLVLKQLLPLLNQPWSFLTSTFVHQSEPLGFPQLKLLSARFTEPRVVSGSLQSHVLFDQGDHRSLRFD